MADRPTAALFTGRSGDAHPDHRPAPIRILRSVARIGHPGTLRRLDNLPITVAEFNRTACRYETSGEAEAPCAHLRGFQHGTSSERFPRQHPTHLTADRTGTRFTIDGRWQCNAMTGHTAPRLQWTHGIGGIAASIESLPPRLRHALGCRRPRSHHGAALEPSVSPARYSAMMPSGSASKACRQPVQHTYHVFPSC